MLYNISITNCDILCSTIFARSVRGKTPTKIQTANVIPIIHANPICHIRRLWCGALCGACSHKINPFQSPQPVRTFTRKNQQNLILCCVERSLYKPNTVTLDLGNIFVTFLFVCVAYLSSAPPIHSLCNRIVVSVVVGLRKICLSACALCVSSLCFKYSWGPPHPVQLIERHISAECWEFI